MCASAEPAGLRPAELRRSHEAKFIRPLLNTERFPALHAAMSSCPPKSQVLHGQRGLLFPAASDNSFAVRDHLCQHGDDFVHTPRWAVGRGEVRVSGQWAGIVDAQGGRPHRASPPPLPSCGSECGGVG